MPLTVKRSKNYIIKSTYIQFLFLIFLNVDSLFNFKDSLLNFFVVTLYIVLEGTLSHILYFGPSFCIMYFIK